MVSSKIILLLIAGLFSVAAIVAFVREHLIHRTASHLIYKVIDPNPELLRLYDSARAILSFLSIKYDVVAPPLVLVERFLGRSLAAVEWVNKKVYVLISPRALYTFEYFELEAIFAHELAHIKNNDALLRYIFSPAIFGFGFIFRVGVVAVKMSAYTLLFALMYDFLSGAETIYFFPTQEVIVPTLLSSVFISSVLFSLGMVVLAWQAHFLRGHEYRADETAVKVLGTADGLISALKKADEISGEAPQMIRYSIFATHPPTKDRIKRIQEIANKL